MCKPGSVVVERRGPVTGVRDSFCCLPRVGIDAGKGRRVYWCRSQCRERAAHVPRHGRLLARVRDRVRGLARGWKANPRAVLEFYNERRKAVLQASPNAAHTAIAALEERFDVVVITQNIDDLHERAGSTNVLHVHGEILKARSSVDPSLVYPLATAVIEMGQLCEQGSQLRPDVVWFGEAVRFMDEAAREFARASRVLTIGTSLSVYPAAGLVSKAKPAAEKVLVAPEIDRPPPGYRFFQGKAAAVVPHIARCWLEGRKPC